MLRGRLRRELKAGRPCDSAEPEDRFRIHRTTDVATKEATMIRVRKAADRGHFDHGWLDTYHSFSFSRYYDPRHTGFRALRVINEDRIAPGQGFGTHGHRDMEIVTYVLEGALAHRDSLGSGGVVGQGELQRMRAGTGITHSEFNASGAEPVHLNQIWLLPEREGFKPSYEQKSFPEPERRNRLRLVAAPDGADGSLTIRQDARLFLGSLEPGREVTTGLRADRHAWVQVLRGEVALNGSRRAAGVGAALSEESGLAIRADVPSEVLLFDLA
jgi:redox-sensitive bicupin YhaK (pirin superfamily)